MSKIFEFKSAGKFQITVDDHTVKLHPKGILNFMSQGGSKGEKSIPIKSITAIQFRKPGLVTSGYIQFAYSGSKESKGGILKAAEDENSITFGKDELPKAQELVDLIERKRHANATTQQSASSSADEILKFKQLLDAGVITQEEFDVKKKQLLGI